MSSVSDPAAKEEVQEGMKTMWERQKSRAERLIHTVFPAKALELDTLLKEKFAKAPPEIVEEVVVTPMDDSASASAAAGTEPGAKRAKLDEQHASGQVLAYDTKGRHGQAGGHVLLRELAAVVRNEVYQMIDNINAVKLWVQLLIPRIEDGGNFGVSIQEETLGEVMRVETECVGIMERFSRYYMARAKFMSKCMKYPHMEDYVLAVQEVDMRFYLTMRITITELRNHYSLVHDHVTKNLEKIKRPRDERPRHMTY